MYLFWWVVPLVVTWNVPAAGWQMVHCGDQQTARRGIKDSGIFIESRPDPLLKVSGAQVYLIMFAAC